jgi:SAM-dependent methyltransferase
MTKDDEHAETDPVAHYNAIYSGLSRSRSYADAILACGGELPTWLVPFSVLGLRDLERFARELRVGAGDSVVDLACGAGGPSVWVAERTGASVTGVDFADAAIVAARTLAEERGVFHRANFVVGDAAATGLADGAFDGLMSIDAIMFVEPGAVAREMARLVRPGGRLVVRAAESVVEPFLPTLVRDYRPTFEAAGLGVEAYEEVAALWERELVLYRALLDRADDLRAEMGSAAELLLEEAAHGVAMAEQPRRVRMRLIVAVKS